jgi:hypothetical protein
MTAGRWIVERVAKLVTERGHRLHPATIIPLCSHTHHGPGGVYASYIVDHLPQASQGFDRGYCEEVALRLTESIVGCVGSLVPVCLSMGSSTWHGLGWQRSDVAFEANEMAVREEFLRWTRARVGPVMSRIGVGAPPEVSTDNVDNFGRLDSRLQTLCLFAVQADPSEDAKLLGAMVFTGVTPSAFVTATTGADPSVSGCDAYSPDVVGAAVSILTSTRYPGAHLGTVASGGFGDVNAVHPTMSVLEFREYRAADIRRERVDPEGHAWVGGNRTSIAGQSWLELPFEIAQAWALVIEESIEDARGTLLRFEGRVRWRNRFGEPRISQSSYPRLFRYRRHDSGRAALGTMPRQMRPGLSMLSASELNATLSSGILGSVGVREGIRRTLRLGKHGSKPRAFGVFSAIITGAAAPGDAFITPFWGIRLLDFEQVQSTGTGEMLRLLAIPGEPCSVMATLLERELAHRSGSDESAGVSVLVAGNCGDYQGYITTPQEYMTQQYEGAATYWGVGTAEWLLSRVAALNGRVLPLLVLRRGAEFVAPEEWARRDILASMEARCTAWKDDVLAERALFATSLLAYGLPTNSLEWQEVKKAVISRAEVVETRQVSLLPSANGRTRFCMGGSSGASPFSAHAMRVSVHWEMPLELLGISPREVVVTLEVSRDETLPVFGELMWRRPVDPALAAEVFTVVNSETAQVLRWAEEIQPDDDGDTTSLFWSCFFRLHSYQAAELVDAAGESILSSSSQPTRWVRARIDAPSVGTKPLARTSWKEVVWR